MISLFTIPKPFTGHVGLIQRNALRSWARLAPDVQVIVCGDEPGCAAVAEEIGAERTGAVERNAYGTPLLNDAFAKAEAAARHEVLAYANADIVLLDDLVASVRRVAMKRWLMIGRRVDLDVTRALSNADLEPPGGIRRWARREGSMHGCGGMDYFVWPRGARLCDLPELAVGRPGWDNYFVWRARYERRLPVIDASQSVLAIHQNHDYAHVPGGDGRNYDGPEADAQRARLGDREASIFDATHVLTPGGLARSRGYEYRHARWKRRRATRALLNAERFLGRTTHAPRRAVRRAIGGLREAA